MDDLDDYDDLEFEYQDEPDNENSEVEDFDGIGFGFMSLPVGNRYLSVHDLPPCLRGEDVDCYYCDFFSPENCKLIRDPSLMAELKSLFEISLSEQASQIDAQASSQKTLIRAVKTELKSHGRPLHYTVLAEMIEDRYPDLNVSERRVLLIMAWHPEEFERVGAGVYAVK